MKNPNNNRPLLSSKNPHFQNEATSTTVLVKMSFICMRMKIIYIWKAEHLTSFPYRGPGELGNGLLYVFLEKVNTFFFPIWAIPENIHTQPRTASMFQPPLAFRNSKMCYPPMPSEFHNHEPPLPFRISVFLEVHFRLSNAYMNKRTWIYASSRLWSSGTRWQALLFSDKKNLPLVARLCKLLFRSEFGYKNKHH